MWAKEIEFYEVKGGVLYRHEPSTKINRRNHVNYQVVLPLSLRPLILKEFHDELTSGHLAFLRTYLKIKNHYYWPTMRKDIKEYCTTCPVCIANTRSPFRTLLHPHELATAPFQVLGMGFLGPITPVSPYRNSYIITDYFSKWVEVALLHYQIIWLKRRATPSINLSSNAMAHQRPSFQIEVPISRLNYFALL